MPPARRALSRPRLVVAWLAIAAVAVGGCAFNPAGERDALARFGRGSSQLSRCLERAGVPAASVKLFVDSLREVPDGVMAIASGKQDPFAIVAAHIGHQQGLGPAQERAVRRCAEQQRP